MQAIAPSASNDRVLHPGLSAFVSANAGSGKTRLLTDRVLNLLLQGIEPSRILCLTYTKAAASEMQQRILARLGDWVMAPPELLSKALAELTGHPPAPPLIAHARSLFARVLEDPEGVRVQTLHGFCQSLLARFPIEAGVTPHFALIEDDAVHELLCEARQRLWSDRDETSAMRAAIDALARDSSETSIHALLEAIIKHKHDFRALFGYAGGEEEAVALAYQRLGVLPNDTPESLHDRHFRRSEESIALLRASLPALLSGKNKTDRKLGEHLAAWLEQPNDRLCMQKDYVSLFVQSDHERRAVVYTAGAALMTPQIEEILREQERAFSYHHACLALAIARRSEHALRLARSLLAHYDALKHARRAMDFDDLILGATSLLRKPSVASWVLYKLDGGIDHLLIDEAQDTSPDQWAIVDALTGDFFSGEGRHALDRSLFVVGDEKQSIFSFQGASVREMSARMDYFQRRVSLGGRDSLSIRMTHSRRSACEVLSAVDGVFAQETARRGVITDDTLTHKALLEHSGLVEWWPAVEADENGPSAPAKLSRLLAGMIRGWLDGDLWLSSKNRAIQPGDIMILLRTRKPLADRIMRALKQAGVPVAGTDRMKLMDNLAAQDLAAIGRALLLPEDDLTLAAAFKSPVFDLDEEDLFELAWNRGEAKLVHRMAALAPLKPSFAKAQALFTRLRARVDFVSPYELYSELLDAGARARFLGRMGAEYEEALDEFLNQILRYERNHTPSMQGFLHSLDTGESEIRRDMEQVSDRVRIMTVHGAKGLQAPVVILPDTISMPKSGEKFLWDNQVPLSIHNQDFDDVHCQKLRQNKKEERLEEYRRLLYVAMTRAEERLYVFGGAQGARKANPDCWHELVRGGLQTIATPFKTPYGQGMRIGGEPLRPVTAAAEETPRQEREVSWEFLAQPAPSEPSPPRPIVPSRPAAAEPPLASPLASDIFVRGRLVHRLLQYLPTLPPKEREAAAQRLAASYRQELPPERLFSCVAEALSVMNDPRFAFLFAPGSMAEVPLAGVVTAGGKSVPVAGQIDRLCTGGHEVWIVDYKTGHGAPERVEDTPGPYLRQLMLYRLLLREIYPEKLVRCALLWTVAPRLDAIPDTLLDEAASSSYI